MAWKQVYKLRVKHRSCHVHIHKHTNIAHSHQHCTCTHTHTNHTHAVRSTCTSIVTGNCNLRQLWGSIKSLGS